MKKILLLLLSLAASYILSAQTNYCQTSVTPANVCSNSFITSVTLANVSNNNQLCDKDQLGGANVDDGYSDYSEMVAYLDPEVPTLLTVTINSLFTDAGVVWVDWNNDGEWTTDEMSVLIGDGYGTETFRALLVPPTGVVTDTLIEGGIRINFDFVEPQLDPCGQNGYGEIEDYSFMVTSSNPPDSTTTNTYCPIQAGAPCNFQWIETFECNNVLQDESTCDRDTPGMFGADGYSDYSDFVIEFESGTPTTALMTVDGNALDQASIFIDWDNSGTWDNDEFYPFSGETTLVNQFIAAIVPPTDAVQGVVIEGGVRVILSFLEPVVDACLNTPNDGEIEDYSFYVVDPSLVTCANIVAPIDSAQNQCTNLNFVWNSVEGAGSYEFLLKNLNQDTIENLILSDTTYASNLLQVSSEYKWLITPIDSNGRKAIGCETLTFFTSADLPPSVSFSPDSLEVCNGSDLQLTPVISGTNHNYDWILGGVNLSDATIEQPVFNATTDGFESLALKVSDQAGCADSAQLVVNVKPLPAVSVLSISSPIICDGDSLEITYTPNNPSQQVEFLEQALPGGVESVVSPNFVNGDQYYFQNSVGEYQYQVALDLNGCLDTVLVDTVKFIQALVSPQLVAEIPVNVGPCAGDEYLLRISNYSDGITWHDGVVNDTNYVSATTLVSAFYELEGCRAFVDSLIEFDDYPVKPNLTSDANGSLCEGDVVTLNHDIQNTSFIWYDADNTQFSKAISSSVSAYVDAISGKGCVTSSDTIHLAFNALPSKPSLTLNGYEPVLCEDESFTIENTDAISKMWSNGETSDEITINQAGDYFLTVTELGCSSNSDTVSANFEAIPAKPSIQLVTENGIDSLMATTVAATYEWTYNGQLTNHFAQTIIASVEGNYQVIAISENGCESEASDVYGYVVGIEELAFQMLDLSVNPTSGNPVWSSKSSSSFDVVVYDYQGKVLDKANGVLNYEANNFVGSYIVNVAIQNKSFVFKMK